MTFGREWALWLVPAAFFLPAAVRLLLRPPRTEVRFGALAVLREALSEAGARRRYRPALALLLRCLGAACAALAFASPVLDGRSLPLGPSAAGTPSDIVFLLDRSYSMRAAYAGSDRFSLAAEAAASALRGIGPADRAALLFFDIKPDGAPAWSGDPGELARRALSASPGWKTTDYRPALEAAFSLLSGSGRPGARKSVVLLSDGSADGLASLGDGPSSLAGYDPAFRLAGLDFPGRAPNSWVESVSRLGAAGSLKASARWNAAASPAPPPRFSVCTPGGGLVPGPLLRRTGALSGSAVFEGEAAAGCVSAGPDSLPADDRAYYAFPWWRRASGPVVLHEGPEEPSPGAAAYFMKKLFSSGALPYPAVFRHYDAAGSVGAPAAGPLVLAGLPPFSPSAAAALDRWFSGGGTVLAFVSSSRPQSSELKSYFGLASAGPEKGTFRASAWPEGALPGFSPSAYDTARVSAGALYALQPGGYETILEFAGADGRPRPALVMARRGSGRAYVWTASLDLAWCDLAVKPAFPAFFSALLELAYSGEAGPGGWGSVVGSPGEVRAARAEGGAAPQLEFPSGRVETLRRRGGSILVPALSEPGLYRWRSGEHGGFYAVNLDLSTGESRLEPASSPPWTRIPADSAAKGLAAFLGGVQAWPVFILAAALLLSLEAALQRRRR